MKGVLKGDLKCGPWFPNFQKGALKFPAFEAYPLGLPRKVGLAYPLGKQGPLEGHGIWQAAGPHTYGYSPPHHATRAAHVTKVCGALFSAPGGGALRMASEGTGYLLNLPSPPAIGFTTMF